MSIKGPDYCEDCAYYRATLCLHELAVFTYNMNRRAKEFVTKPVIREAHSTCGMMREIGGKCGQCASLFTPKTESDK